MQKRLGRHHARAKRRGLGDVGDLFVHAGVHHQCGINAQLFANGKLTGATHLKMHAHLRGSGRQKRVRFHSEAQRDVAADDLLARLQARLERSRIEYERGRAPFSPKLAQAIVPHEAHLLLNLSSRNNRLHGSFVCNLDSFGHFIHFAPPICASAARSTLPFLVSGICSTGISFAGTI